MNSRISASRLQREIEKVVACIVRRFHPTRIILFGSHARGEAGPDSDLDLLVVMPVRGSLRRAQLAVRMALPGVTLPVDVVVTRPKDYEWRRKYPGTIERPASLEGKVLYERGG